MQFAEIDRRRESAGIQQKVLAARAGMKPQDYSRLKRPARHGPTSRTIQRLSTALDALIEEKRDAGH